ncbi:MAG: iron ABC transporter permease, partial [Selenomonas massiliensis]
MSLGQHRTQLFLCALVGALLFAILLSMSSGQYDIPMEAVVASFAHAAGLPIFTDVVVTPE